MAENAGAIEYTIEANAGEAITELKKVEQQNTSLGSSFEKLDTKADATGKQIEKTGKKVAEFNKNTVTTSMSVSKMGGNLGQAGIQVQQFVGQIQGGQDALLALSQQAADVGVVMGAPLVGAILGIGASIAGIAINAMTSTGALEEFIEKLNELEGKDLSKLSGQRQATAESELNKQLNEANRLRDAESKKISDLEDKYKQLEVAKAEAQAAGFAGAVESARMNAITKSIEASKIAVQAYGDQAKVASDKLKILTGETNTNQDEINEQISSLELVAGGFGKAGAELIEYNKQIALQTLETQNATEAEKQRVSEIFNSMIASQKAIDASKAKSKAAREEAAAERLRAAAAREAAEEERKKEEARNALGTSTAGMALGFNTANELQNLQAFYDAGLIAEQEYLAQKLMINQNFQDQLIAMQEQRFRAESDINAFMLDSFEALASTSQNALAGMLTGTMSVKEAMGSLANTIMNQAIGALIDMGLEQVKQQVIGASAMASSAATAAVTGKAIAASYAPAAAMASLATSGSNAAAAQLGISSTVAMSQALAFGGGRATGGPVSGNAFYQMGEGNRPEVLQTGAGMFVAPGDKGRVFNGSQLEQINGGGNKPVINIYTSPGTDASVTENSDGSTDIVIQKIVEQLDNKSGPISDALTRNTNTNWRL